MNNLSQRLLLLKMKNPSIYINEFIKARAVISITKLADFLIDGSE